MVLDDVEGTGPVTQWRSWSPASPGQSLTSVLWNPDTQHRWPDLQEAAVQSPKLSPLHPFKCLQSLNAPQVHSRSSSRPSAVHAATFWRDRKKTEVTSRIALHSQLVRTLLETNSTNAKMYVCWQWQSFTAKVENKMISVTRCGDANR